MSRFVTYFGRLVLMMVGFFAACLAASVFLHLTWFGPLVVGMDATQKPSTAPLYFSVPFLAMLVAHYGFFQALVLMGIGEIWSRRGWLFYALAGAVAALPVAGAMLGGQDTQTFVVATLLGAGMVGGIAYWLVAGRSAGLWWQRIRGSATPQV